MTFAFATHTLREMNTMSRERENHLSLQHRPGMATLRAGMGDHHAMGARIKLLREKHGYTQHRVAEKVGVETRTLQFWEAGSSRPGRTNLVLLAGVYGVTPEWILNGEPEPSKLELVLEEIRLLRAESAAREAEVLSRIEALERSISGTRPQPPR